MEGTIFAIASLLEPEFLLLVVPCLVVIFGTMWMEYRGSRRQQRSFNRQFRLIRDPERPYDWETDGL